MRALTLALTLALAVPSLAWESAQDAASQARALLSDPTVFASGTLSTTYPADYRIEDLRGLPLSQPEYFAPCYENGDLLLLALTVSQNYRNALFSSQSHNATFTVSPNADPSVPDPRHAINSSSSAHSVHAGEYIESSIGEADEGVNAQSLHWDPKRPSWRRGAPSKGRVTLFGTVELLSSSSSSPSSSSSEDELTPSQARKCYLSYHEDASHWAHGAPDSPHTALWARFRVQKVYWVGGFGDEHYIGWIERDVYAGAGADAKLERKAGAAQMSNEEKYDVSHLFGENSEDKSLAKARAEAPRRSKPEAAHRPCFPHGAPAMRLQRPVF